LQFVEVDIAGAHDGGRVLILEQRQQEMFQGGVFVMALVRQGESPVKRLFEAARKSWHYGLTLLSSASRIAPKPRLSPHIVTSSPSRIVEDAGVCGQSPSPASLLSRPPRR